MSISSEAWAIVVATFLGPVLAVAITLWRSEHQSKYSQRLHVFRTLMATRRMAISGEHVTALNLIEVDFYGKPKVEAAWKAYKDFLSSAQPLSDAQLEKRDRLLADLLFQIAKVLRFDIPAMEIFRGGYAPEGWRYRDERRSGAMEFVNELRQGKTVLPIYVVNPQPPPTPDAPEIVPDPSSGT